jgi:glycine/D-amino acid oxidase-like deaminating enzyme
LAPLGKFRAMTNAPIWGEEETLALPQLDGELDADVCVVGLGGSGLACVGALMIDGRRVVGIDAATVAGGAAGRNGGFLLGGLAMFHHDAVTRLGQRAAVAIYHETLKQIDRMTAETPYAIRRVGTLRIAASREERDDCAMQLAAMQRDNLPVEAYSGPEGSGLLFPADAAYDPAARCRTLARHAIASGARLFERTAALSIEEGRVSTPQGLVRAEHIVVAVDGRLEMILPELSSRVRSARLQMLATAPAPEVDFPRPTYARWGLDYWQQLADRRIVLGGCRDAGGDAEWTTDDRPTASIQSALTALLRQRLHVTAEVTHRWAATVAYTQSGLPILEQVRPRVWAIGAYSGTGNVIGALCGRAVAEIIIRGRSEIGELFRA